MVTANRQTSWYFSNFCNLYLQLNLRCLAFPFGTETRDFLIFDFFLNKLQKKDQFNQKNKIKILLITLKISIFNPCLTRKKPPRKVGTLAAFKKNYMNNHNPWVKTGGSAALVVQDADLKRLAYFALWDCLKQK